MLWTIGLFAVFLCYKSISCGKHPHLFLRFYLFLKILVFFIFREGVGGAEREGENQRRVAPTGDLAGNPGMCPDQESTSDLLVCETTPNPLGHTSEGLFIFRETRRWGRKRGRETQIRESNQRPFALQNSGQPTEHTGQSKHPQLYYILCLRVLKVELVGMTTLRFLL